MCKLKAATTLVGSKMLPALIEVKTLNRDAQAWSKLRSCLMPGNRHLIGLMRTYNYGSKYPPIPTIVVLTTSLRVLMAAKV